MPIAQTETIKVTNRFKALTKDSVDEDFTEQLETATEQDAKHQMLEFPLVNVKSKPRKRKNNEVRLKKRSKFRKSTEAKEIVKHFAEMVHKRRPEGEEIEEFSGDIDAMCNIQRTLRTTQGTLRCYALHPRGPGNEELQKRKTRRAARRKTEEKLKVSNPKARYQKVPKKTLRRRRRREEPPKMRSENRFINPMVPLQPIG